MLKENNVRKGFFEHAEFLALRDTLPSPLKDIATFAHKVGWRHSEITELQWIQVDLTNGVVRLEAGMAKNNEPRTIYLDDELLDLFKRKWQDRKKSGCLLPWVFLNKTSNNKVKRFYKAWKSACKEAKIGVRLFHDFRRTAARNMVIAGIPERVAMMISGHKTRSVFERYNIVNDTDLKRAAAKQQAYLENITGTIHQFQPISDSRKTS